MKILFTHQNFPGQFKFLAPALVRQGHEVLALTMQKVLDPAKVHHWQGVQLVPYAAHRASSSTVHPWLSDFETKVIRAEACMRAALVLKAAGYVPDAVVAHPGWGESLFLTRCGRASPWAFIVSSIIKLAGLMWGLTQSFRKPIMPRTPAGFR